MYVGSHKLSEVLFTYFSPGSVMEIFLCVCTVHTYCWDYLLPTLYMSIQLYKLGFIQYIYDEYEYI